MATYKGLTLEEIIECLIDPSNNLDSQLINIFLYTYRNYCNSLDIIKLLNRRLKKLNEKSRSNEWNPGENEGFTRAVIFLLNNWLTFPFAFDFCELPHFNSINYLMNKIRLWPKSISFIKSSPNFIDSFKKLEVKVNNMLGTFNNVHQSNEIKYRELPVDCDLEESFTVPKIYRDDIYNSCFLYQNSEEIAKSLTFIDQQVLENLKLQELLSYIRKNSAQSVTRIIEKYNQLYNVVIFTVKNPALARKRFGPYSGRNSPTYSQYSFQLQNSRKKMDQAFEVIEKWVQILQILSDMRNYSSLWAISTALDNPENIALIKKSSKLYDQYQLLVKINEPHINQNEEQIKSRAHSSSTGSSKVAKTKGRLKKMKIKTCEIPYLGTYLKTLTYIDDGFSDFLNSSTNVYNGSEERLINLDKCRRQFDVLVQIKLCISAIQCNKVEPNNAFIDWYFNLQREMEKQRLKMKSLSSSVSSIHSRKSDSSYESSISFKSMESTPSKSNNMGNISKSKSHQSLSDCLFRNRSFSRPDKVVSSANIAVQNNVSKVATVKLIQPKMTRRNLDIFYKSAFPIPNKNSFTPKKPETISFGAANHRERTPIMNVARSSSTSQEAAKINLDNINYKKIQINENDHTNSFIERVFEKYRTKSLDSSNFEVVQILDNDKQITIPENTNVFYALAEQPEYVIEIRPKDVLNADF